MNTTGNIVKLNPNSNNFNQVLKLDLMDFPKPWKPQSWLDLNWDHHLMYGLETSEGIVAFAFFARTPADDTAHLLKICTSSELRGSGATQKLWQICLKNLKNLDVKFIYLEVESPNQRAISFYKKCGFILLRKIKAYYSDGTDALTMQMTI